MQICGTSIFTYLGGYYASKKAGDMELREDENGGKLKEKAHYKYHIKKKMDHWKNNVSSSYWSDMIVRTRMFYCTHFNRNNQFFKKRKCVFFSSV